MMGTHRDDRGKDPETRGPPCAEEAVANDDNGAKSSQRRLGIFGEFWLENLDARSFFV